MPLINISCNVASSSAKAWRGGGGRVEWTGCYSNVCGHNDHCAGVAVCFRYIWPEVVDGAGGWQGAARSPWPLKYVKIFGIRCLPRLQRGLLLIFMRRRAHSHLPHSLPRHNCHLIASFVLFYCHRERERESEEEVEEKKDRENRSQAKHINLTHDLNSDSVFVWRLEASPAHQQNTTQYNRGDTHTHNSLWHSLCLCDKRC